MAGIILKRDPFGPPSTNIIDQYRELVEKKEQLWKEAFPRRAES